MSGGGRDVREEESWRSSNQPVRQRSPGVSLRRRAWLWGSAACLPDPASGWFQEPAGGRARYAIVGVGSRSQMYQRAINSTFAQHAELVACCDVNPGRLELARQAAVAAGRPAPALYAAADFDRMVKETKPAFVIVTTPCGTHHNYICRAMELGVDVITEKPMTVDAEKCQRILDTQRRTGRPCRVAFNYRYSPPRTQVKDLLMSGVIGDVLSVDFHWLLNTHRTAPTTSAAGTPTRGTRAG